MSHCILFSYRDTCNGAEHALAAEDGVAYHGPIEGLRILARTHWSWSLAVQTSLLGDTSRKKNLIAVKILRRIHRGREVLGRPLIR